MKILITLFFTFSFISSYAQLSTSKKAVPITTPTNVERYGIDYEIKDYTFNISDSSMINALDLNSIEHLRPQTENIEVFDPNSGHTIILFYKKRNKQTTQLNEKL